jgi:hypothetical protein
MSRFARTAFAFFFLITSAMATDPPALNDISTYLVCAGEGQSFVLPQVCDVAYGANGKFVFKAAQVGTVVFNNATFGDPIPGVVKSGYYRFAAGFPVSTVITTGTGLTADYYDNVFVKGFPQRRTDATVNFPWNGAAPMTGIPQANFSVRWTGQIQARFDGDITLITTSDDGVKVWVDGQLLVNDWTAHGNKENVCTFASLAGQKHDLRIDYYQGGGGSFMRLEWQSASEPRSVVPATCLYRIGADTPLVLPTYVPGNGMGLTGDYRNKADLAGSHLRRLDPIINFAWGSGSPAPSISVDNFTVRWTGQIQTRFDGDCTLSTISDDGVRLYLDGRLLIDDWTTHGNKENICTFPSLAGQKHDIRIEYFESGGGAAMYLKWQSANEGYALVPTSCLYPYDMTTAIPVASAVSPAFIEGFYGFTVPSISTGVLCDLGESRFFANVPLSATDETLVTLTEDGTVSGVITWVPTVLASGKNLVVRPGDALLFSAENAGMMTINKGYNVFRVRGPIVPGQVIPVTFPEPGTYTIFEDDAAGARLIEMTIRVPGVVAEPSPIACAVNYTRVKDITLISGADKDLVTWAASDPWIQLSPVMVANAPATQMRFTLKPTENRSAWLIGRINGETGAILANKQVRPFTLTSDSLGYIAIEQAYLDGSILCSANLFLEPIIKDLDIKLYTFSSGVTFEDSSIIRWLTGGDFKSVNTIGIYRYGILRAPGFQTHICHGWVAYQNGIAVSP